MSTDNKFLVANHSTTVGLMKYCIVSSGFNYTQVPLILLTFRELFSLELMTRINSHDNLSINDRFSCFIASKWIHTFITLPFLFFEHISSWDTQNTVMPNSYATVYLSSLLSCHKGYTRSGNKVEMRDIELTTKSFSFRQQRTNDLIREWRQEESSKVTSSPGDEMSMIE
jgi:hypothetical protein